MTPQDFLSKEQVSGPALQVRILDLKRRDPTRTLLVRA